MLRNWHSYSLSPPKKTSRAKNLGQVVDFDGHVFKRQSASAKRLIKYSSEGDQVFLLPLELSPFFGDFFEVVLQATSSMFVTNYPRGYTKVGFCYSQTEKSPVNRLKIRACSKSWRFCGDKLPRNRHEIAASLHGRFGIATKIAAKIAA